MASARLRGSRLFEPGRDITNCPTRSISGITETTFVCHSTRPCYPLQIPPFGHFLPDAMVTALSIFTGLEILWLAFHLPRSRPVRESRRSTPRALSHLITVFLNQIILDTPQFINRTPTLQAPENAHVSESIADGVVRIKPLSHKSSV
jgi:hypothetical protein